MNVIKFFDEVEAIKTQMNALEQLRSCFVNTKTNEIIPVENAGNMDLSDYEFAHSLSSEIIGKIMFNKIQGLMTHPEPERKRKERHYKAIQGADYLHDMKLRVIDIKKISSTKIEYIFEVIYHGTSYFKPKCKSLYYKRKVNDKTVSLLNNKRIKYTANIVNSSLVLSRDNIGEIIEPYLVKLNPPVFQDNELLYYPTDRLYVKKPGRQ